MTSCCFCRLLSVPRDWRKNSPHSLSLSLARFQCLMGYFLFIFSSSSGCSREPTACAIRDTFAGVFSGGVAFGKQERQQHATVTACPHGLCLSVESVSPINHFPRRGHAHVPTQRDGVKGGNDWCCRLIRLPKFSHPILFPPPPKLQQVKRAGVQTHHCTYIHPALQSVAVDLGTFFKLCLHSLFFGLLIALLRYTSGTDKGQGICEAECAHGDVMPHTDTLASPHRTIGGVQYVDVVSRAVTLLASTPPSRRHIV